MIFAEEFTQLMQYMWQMFYNVILNLTTYVNQIMEIVYVLPPFVQQFCVATIAISLVYMILRMI